MSSSRWSIQDTPPGGAKSQAKETQGVAEAIVKVSRNPFVGSAHQKQKARLEVWLFA